MVFNTARKTGFNPYAAGTKRYGASGSTAATAGTPDMTGYAVRDRENAARKQAIINRMKARYLGR